MGNTVLWKPASTAMLRAATTPSCGCWSAPACRSGVINFVPGDGAQISNIALDSPDLAGIHFTGSNFRRLQRYVAEGGARTSARLSVAIRASSAKPAREGLHRRAPVSRSAGGGGRDRPEADSNTRGRSARPASRGAYIPQSLWPEVLDRVVGIMRDMKMGDVADFRTFIGAVIDKKAFDRISAYLDDARAHATVIQGGATRGDDGYFVEPTLIETADPAYRLLCEEIFGPVVTAYVYPDADWAETLATIDRTSPYALTGSVFSTDRAAIVEATNALRNAAGNFYINDKPTGAVVGQQPFGGARASGTNDKAGSKINLLRWVSARTIKESFSPPRDHKYPYMSEE